MNTIKRFILTIILLGNFSTYASKVDFPPYLLTIDQIIFAFKKPFVEKIKDIYSNYVVIDEGNVRKFKVGGSSINCAGKVFNSKESISEIRYVKNESKTKANYVIGYHGCYGRSFRENIYIEGDNIKIDSTNKELLLKGKYSMELNPGENKKTYIFKDLLNEIEVIKVVMNRNNKGYDAHFFSDRVKLFSVFYRPEKGKSIAYFKYFSYSVSFKNKFVFNNKYNFTQRISFTPHKLGTEMFFNSHNTKISKSSFLGVVETYIFSPLTAIGNHYKSIVNSSFPRTKKSTSNITNKKLIDELDVALSRIITRSDLVLVEQTIRELLEAAINDRLEDKR